MQRWKVALYAVAAVLMFLMASSAEALKPKDGTVQDTPIVTGEHWVAATVKERQAFLLGMATIIELEQEVKGEHPSEGCRTLIHSWVKGLSGYTLTHLRAKLDTWYADHPDKQQRPVVEVLWYEFVTPKLAKTQ